MGLSSKWNVVVFVFCTARANLHSYSQHTDIVDIISYDFGTHRKRHKFGVPYMGYGLPLQGNSMNYSRVMTMAL
jgi:hypothetical protein